MQALFIKRRVLLIGECVRCDGCFVAVAGNGSGVQWRPSRVSPIKSPFLLCTAVTPNFCSGRPVVLRDCCPHMSTSAPSHNQLDSKAEAWSA
ncbi:MAG: argininosuccinate lyase, partial [Comamonas sp.]|nr:argininosuccinate lyase [Comamonas sp.]